MQKRLGIYEPAPERQSIAERKPQPVRQTPGWETYNAGRKAQAAAKAAAVLAQQKQHEAERRALAEQQQERRAEVLQGSWKGKGTLRNALQSVLAAEQAAESAAVVERHQGERRELAQQFRPWPSLEDWQRQQQHPEGAETPRRTLAVIKGDTAEPPTPRDIRSFKPEIHGEQVHYSRREEPRDVAAAFIDKGVRIAIQDLQRDSVLAALQLSAAKWDSFTVSGSAAYKALAVSLAAEHGFKISNPELQGAIVQARAERQAQAPGLKPSTKGREAPEGPTPPTGRRSGGHGR